MFSEFEINDVNKHYLRFRISSGANLVTLASNSLVGTYKLKIVGGFRVADWTLPATLITFLSGISASAANLLPPPRDAV